MPVILKAADEIERWFNRQRNKLVAPLAMRRLITIESLRRAQPRRSYAATSFPPLPRRFHDRNFELKFRQQKTLKNKTFSRA
jgi:hypothetical protein